MRRTRSIWIALVLVPGLALAARAHGPRPRPAPAPPLAPPSQTGPKVCDEACLGGYVDKVLQAMMDHDPSQAPLAPDVRYTENGEVLRPGDGLWRSATAIAMADDGLSSLGRNSSAYRLYFADVASGQAAYFGAFTQDRTPGMMMLRVRVAAGRIAEIEAATVLQTDAAPPGLPAFAPRGFDQPEPALLAGGERWAPAIMTAAANRYFDGMQTSSSAGVPLAADCVRRDNGVRTTGDPATPAFAFSCAGQLDGAFFRDVLRVRRRILVVDEARGLVMAVAMVDRGNRPDPSKKPKARRGAPPAPPPTLSTGFMGVVFKMSEGKITRIEAIDRPEPNDMGLGWPG